MEKGVQEEISAVAGLPTRRRQKLWSCLPGSNGGSFSHPCRLLPLVLTLLMATGSPQHGVCPAWAGYSGPLLSFTGTEELDGQLEREHCPELDSPFPTQVAPMGRPLLLWDCAPSLRMKELFPMALASRKEMVEAFPAGQSISASPASSC